MRRAGIATVYRSQRQHRRVPATVGGRFVPQVDQQVVDESKFALLAFPVVFAVGCFFEEFGQQPGENLSESPPSRCAGEMFDLGMASVAQLKSDLAVASVEQQVVKTIRKEVGWGHGGRLPVAGKQGPGYPKNTP